MGDVSLAAVRLLRQVPELSALNLIGSTDGVPWIQDSRPLGSVENTGKCLLVVSEGVPAAIMNEHNTALYANLVVDIWADPTRAAGGDVQKQDAEDKIKKIVKVLHSVFHLVHNGVPYDAPLYLGVRGMPRVWGTAAQISARTGLHVHTSHHTSGPSVSPIRDNVGGQMGVVTYTVEYQ